MSAAPYTAPTRYRKSNDPRPAESLWNYVWIMTGKSQYLAISLSLVTTVLALAPIELQRRMIDDAITDGDLHLLIVLSSIFAATVVLLQLAKLWLGVLQGWMSENAMLDTRSFLWTLRAQEGGDKEKGSDIVSVLTTETQALAGFAGGGPSSAISNVSMLVATLAYMFWVAPMVALAGLALLLPQAVLAPLMQSRLNRLVSIQVKLNRGFTAAIDRKDRADDREIDHRLLRMFQNRMSFYWWKFIMKALLNVLNSMAPIGVLAIGGWLVITGDTTLGVIVAFVSGFRRLGDPIRQLIGFYREASEARVRHAMIAEWMTRQRNLQV